MRRVLLLSLTIVIPLLSGCAERLRPAMQAPITVAAQRPDNVRGARAGDLRFKDGLPTDSNDRLVISSASIHIEAVHEDTVRARVVGLAEKYKGYVLYSGESRTTIRVPATRFYDAIAEIETFGKVTGKDISGQDVTDEYQDLNTRLDNAEKTRLRYLALLDKAENVNEMLSIERELERINGQIESLKGKLARMSEQVEYSSITVSTLKAIRPGPIGYVFYGLYKGVSWLFVWQ
jgi:hypothetical protein